MKLMFSKQHCPHCGCRLKRKLVYTKAEIWILTYRMEICIEMRIDNMTGDSRDFHLGVRDVPPISKILCAFQNVTVFICIEVHVD